MIWTCVTIRCGINIKHQIHQHILIRITRDVPVHVHPVYMHTQYRYMRYNRSISQSFTVRYMFKYLCVSFTIVTFRDGGIISSL